MGINRFGCCDDDGLDTNEAERGVDERGQEAEEVACRTGDTVVVCPRSRVIPVAESNGIAVRTAACSNDNGDNNQAKEAEDLDGTSKDFGFTIESHTHQIDSQNEYQSNGDHHSRRDIRPI